MAVITLAHSRHCFSYTIFHEKCSLRRSHHKKTKASSQYAPGMKGLKVVLAPGMVKKYDILANASDTDALPRICFTVGLK